MKEEYMEYKELTQDDFVLRVYPWTKISQYATTEQGVLIKLDKILSDGYPFYLCLYEGWWEPFDACHSVAIRDVLEAEPVNLKVARAIMRKEEKPLEKRPEERNQWICPY